jgi:uncharacterized membrane protein
MGSIAAGGSNSFTVTPKTGLSAGTHTATVTVSGGYNITSKNFSVSFTVNAATYGISLSPETWTFPSASVGYGAQSSKTIYIINSGNQPTGSLTVALSSSSSFTISATTISSIAAGGGNSFTVVPKTGLATGTYTATVTVSGGSNITSKSFSVSFTVEDPSITGFSSVAAAIAYLESYAGGSSFNAPVPLKMNINFATATDGWTALLNGLATVNKYVALDLSSCSMGGTATAFTLSSGTGRSCIASLVLPDSVTSIAGAGQTTTSPYPNLKAISGTNVTSIGTWTFYYYTSLTTVNFPETTTIGNSAFAGCTSLTTASFPKATSIGSAAFYNCSALTSVSFLEATSLVNQAFWGCTSLTTVSFPEVTSIGYSAFENCTFLTTASFPKATSIGQQAFWRCTSLTTVSLPEATSIGNWAFGITGTTPLTITMGAVAPTVDYNMFLEVAGTKNVTVRVPTNATGYTSTWQTAFKGYGNYGTNHGTVNSYINLVIQYDGASITLSQTETHIFPSAPVGYGAQTAKSVTVSNNGNQPTGNLTVSLSNNSAFTLSTTSISSIGVGGSNFFTVTPKTSLAAGTYTATVTVSGGSNITSKSFNVSFTVNAAPTYGISLSPETWTFPAATVGYGAQTAKSVTITNTGNQPTGNLALALSSSSYFTLSATSMGSIAASGSNSFTVTPKTGLAAGTYTATVTVSGSSVTSKSFSVSFTVNPAPTYGISLNPETWTFPAASVGYGAQAAKSVTVTNTGNQPTGNLTLALSSSSAFTLSATSMGSIAAGGSNSFTVTPKTGLSAGTYSATVTVSGGSNITSKNFSVSFTVNDPSVPTGGWTNVADAMAYLDAHTGGNTVDNPVLLKMNVNLTSQANGWEVIRNALVSNTTKYVALDLSSCMMTSTFNHTPPNIYIVSLVIPDSVTRIAGVGPTTPPGQFQLYPNFKTISGKNVTSIGDNTFRDWSALATVSFPKVTSIGNAAFYCCTSLTTASFPEATSIGQAAFGGCTSLITVSIPEATSIGGSAFGGTALTTASFPEAMTIGDGAFAGCTSLTTVSFPEAMTIGDGAFSGCTSLTTVSFPKVASIEEYALTTSIGNYAFINCTALTTASFPEAMSIGYDAFDHCTSLTTASFPKATSIGEYAFSHCTALTALSIPKVSSIGRGAFVWSGTTPLTITMGAVAPTIGTGDMFYGNTNTKTVTVRVPNGATGYTGYWQIAFRGYFDSGRTIQYY